MDPVMRPHDGHENIIDDGEEQEMLLCRPSRRIRASISNVVSMMVVRGLLMMGLVRLSQMEKIQRKRFSSSRSARLRNSWV